MLLKSIFASALVGFAALAWATTPSSGTLSPSNPSITATGGPYLISNPSATAELVCGPQLCDDFDLTLAFPEGFATQNPTTGVRFDLTWDSAVDDLDLYLIDRATGAEIGASASATPGERVELPLSRLPNEIRVRIVPFAVTGSTATLRITVEQLAAGPGGEADPCVQTNTASSGNRIDAGILEDIARLGLGPTDLYGAFVHFNMGTHKRQDALLASLGLTKTHDFRQYARSVYVTGPVATLLSLGNHPWVARIEHNAPLRYFDATGPWATRVRVAQEPVSGGPYFDAAGNRLTGQGVTLGVIDSGLFGPHPDFAGRVLNNYKLLTPGSIVPNPLGNDGESLYVDVGELGDSESNVGGHGTHVTGTVAGGGQASDGGYPAGTGPLVPGTYAGVAPDAKIVHWGHGAALFVLDVVSAYTHVINNVKAGTYNPQLRAINNSYGGSGTYNPADTASCLIKEIIRNNVVMVFAAGNDGGDGSQVRTSPQCQDPTPGVICVASYNDRGMGDRNAPLSGFSSRGKIGAPETYPDIAAPGDLITSTCLQGQPSQAICTGGSDGAAEVNWQPWYGTISGTSMAAPHVTGAIGLIVQARPELTPAEIEQLIQRTARQVGDGYEPDPQNPGHVHHFAYGAGLLDIPAALDALNVAKAGLPTAGEPWTVLDNNPANTGAPGAAHVQRLTMQEMTEEGLTGVEYVLTLANATMLGANTSLTYRIEQNVAGVATRTSVVATSSGVSIPDGGEDNSALATRVSRDGNAIRLFVPYQHLGFPSVGEPIHNIRVVVEGDSGAVAFAPTPAATPAALASTQPMFGRPFTIQLPPGTPPPSTERSCILPGFTMITSPSGVTGNGSGTGQDDLRTLWIAEPSDMPGKLVFTVKVDNLDPAPIPQHRWYVYYNRPDSTDSLWAAMDTLQGTPRYLHGTRDVIALPALSAGVFTVSGNLDPASSFDTDGTIRLVLDKAAMGLETGMTLTNIAVAIRQTTNPANGLGLTVDSGSALRGYTLVGNDVCAAPDAPAPDTGSPPVVLPTPTPPPGPGGFIDGSDRRLGQGVGAFGSVLFGLFGLLALRGLRRRRG